MALYSFINSTFKHNGDTLLKNLPWKSYQSKGGIVPVRAMKTFSAGLANLRHARPISYAAFTAVNIFYFFCPTSASVFWNISVHIHISVYSLYTYTYLTVYRLYTYTYLTVYRLYTYTYLTVYSLYTYTYLTVYRLYTNYRRYQLTSKWNIFTQIGSSAKCWLDIYHRGVGLAVTANMWHWNKRFRVFLSNRK
jgi:hypothetical protein